MSNRSANLRPALVSHAAKLNLFLLFERVQGDPRWVIYSKQTGREVGKYHPKSGLLYVLSNEPVREENPHAMLKHVSGVLSAA